jgi:hypothetical protein
MDISLSSLRVKKKNMFQQSHDSAIRLMYGTGDSHFQYQFPPKKIGTGDE